ncbi:cobalt-precorrin-6A reductase [Pseudomonas caspiana]
MKRLLLLGGVTDALAIARTLGPQHIYSLAGVGRVPTDLTCQVRVGGYGGAQGLAQFMTEQDIDLLVDATHPYAAQISHNAARAAELAQVPCWALRRPAWQAGPNDDWRDVADWRELIEALKPFKRPLFTLGREPLQHLDEIPAQQFWTLRALENTLRDLPQHERCEVIGARGPFLLEDERALFEQRAIDVLISKNSGGDATEAKLEVARELRVPVLILKRPALPKVDREFDSRQALLEALGHNHL